MENMVTIQELERTFSRKKVLITGDTGFKGSWLSLLLLRLNSNVYGYSLDPLRPNDNYCTTHLHKHINHVTGDVRDRETLKRYFQEVRPDFVFHLAAQPLVLESYRNPAYTFETNLMGTVNFLEALRNTTDIKAAVVITSDKCYRNNEGLRGYQEDDPMGGDDPYSASKGCSELIANAYYHSFFRNSPCALATARAGNVIGGGDWAENRIVPDIYRAVQNKEKIVLRNPRSVRPWQFVLEPLMGYLFLCHALSQRGKEMSGGWNFGPESGSEKSVEDLTRAILGYFPGSEFEVAEENEKFHEAGYLKLDISKAQKHLGWSPVLDFGQAVRFTVRGYKDETDSKHLFSQRMQQIDEFLDICNQKFK